MYVKRELTMQSLHRILNIPTNWLPYFNYLFMWTNLLDFNYSDKLHILIISVTAMQKLVVQLGTPSETPNVKKQLDTKRSEVQKSIETTGEMFRQATDLCKEGSPQEQVCFCFHICLSDNFYVCLSVCLAGCLSVCLSSNVRIVWFSFF